jgi:hypothetical protein
VVQRTRRGKVIKDKEGKPLFHDRTHYIDKPPRCPTCSEEGNRVSYDFRLPKARDLKGWKLAKILFERRGPIWTNPILRTFCPACVIKDRPPYPKSVKEIV